MSERRACRVLGQYRSTQRKVPTTLDDEAAFIADMIELARQFGRSGYRRITKMLQSAGWSDNKKRVEQLWRREELKVSSKQPKRGRLWLNDGSFFLPFPSSHCCAFYKRPATLISRQPGTIVRRYDYFNWRRVKSVAGVVDLRAVR